MDKRQTGTVTEKSSVIKYSEKGKIVLIAQNEIRFASFKVCLLAHKILSSF